MEKEIKIVSIVGPTACGKTKLALSLAEKFDIEIVSADSIQVYKEFNILSAKPTKKELLSVKHHLIDIISVEEDYSVAKFTTSAHKCISEIHSRGKLPVLVGGTGLYVDSLLKNLSYPKPKAESNCEDLKCLLNAELMEILLKVDIKSAKKIFLSPKNTGCKRTTSSGIFDRQFRNFIFSDFRLKNQDIFETQPY